MVALVAVALAATLASQGFYPIGENHGVKVYRRDRGRGIELAAEGLIDAPPETVRAVLLDYASHPKWVKGLTESKVLRRDAAQLLVYQRLDLPVLDDRDFTLKVRWGDDGETKWLHFTTANDQGPGPRAGVVRVNTHEGAWQLTPVNGGRATWAVYRFHLDLAGSFPSWMGKGKAGKDVPNLFQNIRRQIPYYRR